MVETTCVVETLTKNVSMLVVVSRVGARNTVASSSSETVVNILGID